jgi:photosystem II stability/assembly factor-like uncharacterized protein
MRSVDISNVIGLAIVEQTPFPVPGGALNDDDVVDANTAWAVGTSGTILMTSNGGETWSRQASGQDQYLFDVCAENSNVAWVAGMSGGDAVVLSTSNAGSNWIAHDAVKTQVRAVPVIEPYIASVQAMGVAAVDAF